MGRSGLASFVGRRRREAAAVIVSLAAHALVVVSLRGEPGGATAPALVPIAVDRGVADEAAATSRAAPLRTRRGGPPTPAPATVRRGRHAVARAPNATGNARGVDGRNAARTGAGSDARSDDADARRDDSDARRDDSDARRDDSDARRDERDARDDSPAAASASATTRATRPAGAAASGAVVELTAGRGPSFAHPPALDPGSCTEHLEYPDRAMLLGKEGVVRMILSLDERGRVLQAKVTGRAGYGLDEAALEAVKTRCRFAPARDGRGQPTPALIEHLFYFHIGDFRNRYDH